MLFFAPHAVPWQLIHCLGTCTTMTTATTATTAATLRPPCHSTQSHSWPNAHHHTCDTTPTAAAASFH